MSTKGSAAESEKEETPTASTCAVSFSNFGELNFTFVETFLFSKVGKYDVKTRFLIGSDPITQPEPDQLFWGIGSTEPNPLISPSGSELRRLESKQ